MEAVSDIGPGQQGSRHLGTTPPLPHPHLSGFLMLSAPCWGSSAHRLKGTSVCTRLRAHSRARDCGLHK